MVLDRPVEEMEGQPASPINISIGATVYGLFLGALVFAGGLAWNPLSAASTQGTKDFEGVIMGSPNDNAGAAPPIGGIGQPKGAGQPKGGQLKGGQPKGGVQPKEK